MSDILNKKPNNDSGTDTLERYRYQARIALPFCLSCANQKGENLRSIVMEHFEDIVLEYSDYWHFIQVKTRNASRGLWKLNDATGGLKSLYRTFNEISDPNAKYSLWIEGTIKPDDLLMDLTSLNNISNELVEKVSKNLDIQKDECKNFLKFVTVRAELPPRESIISQNIMLMGDIFKNTPVHQLKSLEEKLTDEIFRAMSCERLPNYLYHYIAKLQDAEEEVKSRIKAKRLTASNISDIIGLDISSNSPILLQLFTDLNAPKRTKLEEKLLVAGASERIIKSAKTLRANASIHEAEILSSTLMETKVLVDVQLRLEILTDSIVEKLSNLDEPAKTIWCELLDELIKKASFIDPNQIYKQDPYLLLGAACGLSDECRIDWGVKIA
ncbi:dsDNA nuclease domain-containing protein [Oscillatoria acuminata]|uniref:CD-NTase associated protein 4-like DNA endonuclease domain-containing protein n=1 Tax=Oscillatoria acuminata PCC 6304 TaxID=56110 RepID=K9TCT4_9CYAN|nr:dsDNA nuclease domain-containing protein [Oscillatoria acuminata]AFY80330.1 hypothetical protein Oscil6304_0590 [Oscillatoria acuminata PCC 6304]